MRKKARYALKFKVTFCWRNEAGKSSVGTGVSRDISTAGMFVSSDDYPPTSARLECEVTVPRPQSGGSLQLKTFGRVIRTETGKSSGPGGFAVVGDMRLADDDALVLFADGADSSEPRGPRNVM